MEYIKLKMQKVSSEIEILELKKKSLTAIDIFLSHSLSFRTTVAFLEYEPHHYMHYLRIRFMLILRESDLKCILNM